MILLADPFYRKAVVQIEGAPRKHRTEAIVGSAPEEPNVQPCCRSKHEYDHECLLER